MNSLTRDSVILTVAPLAVVCTVGTIFLASAQPLPTLDPEICATPTSDVDAEASFLAVRDVGKLRSRHSTGHTNCWSIISVGSLGVLC
jgi:hypothetical protein